MGQEEVYEILNVLEFNRLVRQVLACRYQLGKRRNDLNGFFVILPPALARGCL